MKTNRGITLIALIITIAVLSIIGSIVVMSSTKTVDYTKETKFIAEIKVIREKANIIKKELELGSNAYINAGKNINSLTSEIKTKADELLLKYNIQEENKVDYKYFDMNELEKIGIYKIEQSVLINFKTSDIISVNGITINGVEYHKINEIEEKNKKGSI